MLKTNNQNGKAWRVLFDTRKASYEYWVNIRSQYITGTDAGIIANVNPYCSKFKLFQQKAGKIGKDPETPPMRIGRLVEPIIRQLYSDETGLQVKEFPYMVSSTRFGWMAGNIDGAVKLPSGWSIFEAKCLGPRTGSTDYANGEKSGFVSPSHLLQLYHYMTIFNIRTSVLCCMLSAQKIVHQIIDFDDETANSLIDLERTFYFDYLKKGVAPPVSSMDNDLLAQLYPKTEINEITLPDSAGKLISDYLAAADEIKRWQVQKDQAEAQLKEMMGSNTSAVCGDKRIKWTEVTSKRINAMKIKEIVPADQLALCYQESSYRKFGISTIKSK